MRFTTKQTGNKEKKMNSILFMPCKKHFNHLQICWSWIINMKIYHGFEFGEWHWLHCFYTRSDQVSLNHKGKHIFATSQHSFPVSLDFIFSRSHPFELGFFVLVVVCFSAVPFIHDFSPVRQHKNILLFFRLKIVYIFVSYITYSVYSVRVCCVENHIHSISFIASAMQVATCNLDSMHFQQSIQLWIRWQKFYFKRKHI